MFRRRICRVFVNVSLWYSSVLPFASIIIILPLPLLSFVCLTSSSISFPPPSSPLLLITSNRHHSPSPPSPCHHPPSTLSSSLLFIFVSLLTSSKLYFQHNISLPSLFNSLFPSLPSLIIFSLFFHLLRLLPIHLSFSPSLPKASFISDPAFSLSSPSFPFLRLPASLSSPAN